MKSFTAHYKDLARLGLPIVIGQLGIIFVSFVDTFMVSQHHGNDLAAASFVNNMFNLAIIFATGFSYGLTPIVGKFFGKGKKDPQKLKALREEATKTENRINTYDKKLLNLEASSVLKGVLLREKQKAYKRAAPLPFILTFSGKSLQRY